MGDGLWVIGVNYLVKNRTPELSWIEVIPSVDLPVKVLWHCMKASEEHLCTSWRVFRGMEVVS